MFGDFGLGHKPGKGSGFGGQVHDKEAGVEENTIVIFTSDNGPEATRPWEGDGGPWPGTYFTAMEASLRVPFIIRWPGKVPAGAVSNEIVHIVDLYPTLASVGGAEVPKDRPIDGVDQLDSSSANKSTPTAKGFLPMSLIGCLLSNGKTGRHILSGR